MRHRNRHKAVRYVRYLAADPDGVRRRPAGRRPRSGPGARRAAARNRAQRRLRRRQRAAHHRARPGAALRLAAVRDRAPRRGGAAGRDARHRSVPFHPNRRGQFFRAGTGRRYRDAVGRRLFRRRGERRRGRLDPPRRGPALCLRLRPRRSQAPRPRARPRELKDMPDGPRYEDDFYAWTQYQAEVLRTLPTSDNRFDREHLAEEIEDLGKSERDAVRSQVQRILIHFLKLSHSPARDPRFDWIDSIIDARGALADKLSPTLRRDIEAELTRIYGIARKRAAVQLQRHGEYEAAQSLLADCPYTIDQILAEDWYPESTDGA